MNQHTVSRAFSARSEAINIPGALPQPRHEAAPLALSDYDNGSAGGTEPQLNYRRLVFNPFHAPQSTFSCSHLFNHRISPRKCSPWSWLIEVKGRRRSPCWLGRWTAQMPGPWRLQAVGDSTAHSPWNSIRIHRPAPRESYCTRPLFRVASASVISARRLIHGLTSSSAPARNGGRFCRWAQRATAIHLINVSRLSRAIHF